jgi:hypothetical protein
MIRMGAVLKCLKLIPKSVNDVRRRLRRNSWVSVRTRWHVEAADYLLNCIMVRSYKLLLDIFLDIFHDTQCPICNGILVLDFLFVLVSVPNDLAPK